MNKTRCKFVVSGVSTNNGCTNLSASPVGPGEETDWQPCEENKEFWEATPCGSLELSVMNNSLDHIKEGDQFYLDLIPIEK